MNHGWQSESTDRLKGGWTCFLEWLQWLQWSPGRSPHPQLPDVAWCSAAAVVVVVWWSCSCGLMFLVLRSCSCICGGVISVM